MTPDITVTEVVLVVERGLVEVPVQVLLIKVLLVVTIQHLLKQLVVVEEQVLLVVAAEAMVDMVVLVYNLQ